MQQGVGDSLIMMGLCKEKRGDTGLRGFGRV